MNVAAHRPSIAQDMHTTSVQQKFWRILFVRHTQGPKFGAWYSGASNATVGLAGLAMRLDRDPIIAVGP